MEEQDEGKFDPTSFQFDKADEEKFDPTSFRFDKAILTETQEKWKDANKRPEVMAEEAIFEMNRNLSLGVVTGMFYGVWLAKRKVTQKAVDAHVDKYKFDVALAAESKKKYPSFSPVSGVNPSPQNPGVYKKLKTKSLGTLMKENPRLFMDGARIHAIQLGILTGVFTATDISLRFWRQTNDALNRGISGALAGGLLGYARGGYASGVTLGFIVSFGSVWAHVTGNLALPLLRHFADEEDLEGLPERV